MKTIELPVTNNEQFNIIARNIWNSYAFICYGDDVFFEDEDKEYMANKLKQVLKRLNTLSKYVR